MILHGDCLDKLKELDENSIDCLVTDPPYGINFMGKSWDNFEKGQNDLKETFEKNIKKHGRKYGDQTEGDLAISMKSNHPIYKFEGMNQFFTPIFKECLRVMKPGSFGFICCIPRQDCLSRMMISLEDAGFNINFSSIYWTYASGFPKAMNIGKKLDKKDIDHNMEGSYAGFQPKPAVECIIVVMKPLSEGSYINQAMKDGKGVTWLDDCRVPYADENDVVSIAGGGKTFHGEEYKKPEFKIKTDGRFAANLLISDQILDDGKPHSGGHGVGFSRFYDLDKWAQRNLPFIICPKAPKKEKNAGCENFSSIGDVCEKCGNDKNYEGKGVCEYCGGKIIKSKVTKNNHPTVKPMKLMSYLITLGSRENDVILDPFSGSFTTYCSAIMLNRKCVGIEKEDEYIEIGKARVKYYQDLFSKQPLKV